MNMLLLASTLLSASQSCVCWAWLAPRNFPLIPPPLQQRRGYIRHHISSKQVGSGRGDSWSISPLFAGMSIDVDGKAPTPPVPFRDETSFVLAGDVVSSTSSTEDTTTTSPSSPLPIRQSISSTNPLLSPPRPIPNPYGWMRDDSRTDENVLNHLHAENEYGEQITSHLEDLRKELYHEFLSSIQETDYTTPSLKTVAGGTSYWYYVRFEEGESYPRYCRAPQTDNEIFPPTVNENWDKKVTNSNNETALPQLLPGEEVYLDVPALARNRSYLAVGAIAISPNQKYLAYSLDEKGGETCQLYVKHIESGQEWVLHENATDVLECDGSVVWSDESNALYYVIMDETHRPYQLYRRQIFDSNWQWIDAEDQKEEDELLLEESDELFNLRISKTFGGKYLNVKSSSKESSEVHYLDLRSDESKLTCIAKRQPKVLYSVTHCRGYWLVETNIGGLPNLSLKACLVGEEGMDCWKDVGNIDADVPIPVFDGGHERSLDGVTIFNPTSDDASPSPLARAVVTGREDGMPRVWVLELNDEEAGTNGFSSLAVSQMTRLEFDENAYDVGIGGNRDPSLPYVVISYDSLVTPPSHIAIPLSNPTDLGARKVLKEKIVPGYDKESYACERTMVKSRDGKTEIPVSLVYHRDVLEERENGAIPTHLFGYGSYGASIEASFRSTRLPLLKRKVVYALAHTRGGGEMGRPWYDEAKYLTKKNTFNDFVDVARWLVGEEASDEANTQRSSEPSIGKGITTPSQLSCEGRSAGGLLVGASLNQHPELFRAAILGVPFVDVACTMIDATIPLTVAEWEEWGNPNEEEYFDYIMSYCPMRNIKSGSVYPSCLITGGLHDPRVQYWEPAKFAAELRHLSSEESGPVVLKMDMESGHFSASDRYKYLRELAFDYAFLLDALGCS